MPLHYSMIFFGGGTAPFIRLSAYTKKTAAPFFENPRKPQTQEHLGKSFNQETMHGYI